MTQFERKTYHREDDFKVFLEEIDGNVFIHVAIDNFSKTVLQKIKEVWAEVVMKMYFLGYEELFAYTKDPRIINMIGGAKEIGKHQDYEVYKWELN